MPSAPWHPYVFDGQQRAFVGDFEGMYRAEKAGGFDSWHQSDPRRLDSQISLLLLHQISFRTAIDLGCGKGSFTAALARRDSRITGVDVAPTAIAAAAAQFPDLDWVCAPAAEYLVDAAPVDLILAREVLSYLEDWRQVVARAAALTRYLLISLYIPPDPIGFVSSQTALAEEFERHFELIEAVALPRRGFGIYLGERGPTGATGKV